MNTGKSTITTNTGCKYPGTPMTDLYRIKELEWEQVGKVLQAALGFSSYTLVVIDGEWVLKIYTDGVKDTYKLDSEHQAKAAANEHHRKEAEKMLSPVESGWQPIETAPKDGSLLLLLTSGSDNLVEDAIHSRTIGHNSFEHTEVDEWQMAGWCWSHDHYTDGRGTPTHWQPLPPAPGGEI